MTGEKDLQTLVADMDPHIDTAFYAFVVVESDFQCPIPPLMRFQEAEGDTLIVTRNDLLDSYGHDGRWFRRITLNIHSDLEAVGLTAAVSTCLTKAGICANIVAGFYHDHIFILDKDAPYALEALKKLSKAA